MLCEIWMLITLLLTQVSAQSCSCDLVNAVCEIDCCCDSDCSSNDAATFLFCIGDSFNASNQLCVHDQVVFYNNPNIVSQLRQDDLFCIVENSFSERNFYTSPSCLTGAAASCFNNLLTRFRFVSPSTSIPASLDVYRAGDSIITQYLSTAQGILSTPGPGVNNVCTESNPVHHFYPRTTLCNRLISNLSTACEEESALDYSSYTSFKVFSRPNMTAANPLDVTSTCLSNGASVMCDIPQFIGTSCTNAVLSLSYLVTSNDFNEIQSTEATFTIASITQDDLPLTQSFTVMFQTLTTNASSAVSKSGNPGYLVGKPLLTALVLSTGDPSFNSEVFLITPDSRGYCTGLNVKLPLRFQQNQRSGCLVNVSTDCADLQLTIRNELDRLLFNSGASVYLALYGNANTNAFNANEWLLLEPGTFLSSPTKSASSCGNIILSSHIDVSYSNTGFRTSPQPRLVSVRHSYGEPEDVVFTCPPGTCVQMVEIFSSVNFVDVSETYLSRQQTLPTIEEKLPVNFFFPLKWMNSAAFYHFPNFIVILLCFLCVREVTVVLSCLD